MESTRAARLGGDTLLSADCVDDGDRRLHARVGSVLCNKWRVDALLGVGGVAAVYRGTHRSGHRVAIKILHPEHCANESVRTRFLREAYVANLVGHPGALAILDDDVTEDGAAFLVMELLEGETLEARWRRMGIPPDAREVLAIAEQVLDVLAAAHERGIVHRDVNPANLYLLNDGRVKVLDFGISSLREFSAAPDTAGIPMGTPAFMPPEQAYGRWDLVDARSDLWALGATMFRALTGRFVHEAETVSEHLLATATRPAPSVAAIAPAAPRVLVDIVDRALAFERDARWPNARAMQKAIRQATHQVCGRPLWIETTPALGTPTPPPPDPPRANRARPPKWTNVAALAAFVMVLAFGVLAAARAVDRRDDARSASVGPPNISGIAERRVALATPRQPDVDAAQPAGAAGALPDSGAASDATGSGGAAATTASDEPLAAAPPTGATASRRPSRPAPVHGRTESPLDRRH